MAEKTHYRKAFDSPYLGSADVVDPITLTIARVELEIDHTKQSKDLFNTAYFVEKFIRSGEKLKPMILNATNSKFIAQLTGSKFIDDWCNVAITVYVDPDVRFGKQTVEGLRLMAPPKVPAVSQELLAAGTAASAAGVAPYAKWWSGLTKGERTSIGLSRHTEFKNLAERVAAAASATPPVGEPDFGDVAPDPAS